jgi:GH15 family glucan-1,4-alpha-glucosidase
MPRHLSLGNERMLVSFDADYRLRDLYYPHIGSENHVGGAIARTGVHVDGEFHWLERAAGWSIAIGYEPDTLVGRVEARHEELGLALVFTDAVDFHEALYVREIAVRNLRPTPRAVRLYFHQNFAISNSELGDTAAFDPKTGGVVHFKGARYFLANVMVGSTVGASDWATGQKGVGGKEGTFRDAEDGVLGKNPIAQGAVDSVLAAACDVAAGGSAAVSYWIAAGQRWEGAWDGVRELDAKVVARKPSTFLARTRDYWRLWVTKENQDFADLPEPLGDLYNRSLLVLRMHLDTGGALIASTDSDIISFARDTYSYCWPRDGALAARAIDAAGYETPPLTFFEFCADHLTDQGYLMHKYTAEGALGSSWHPWIDLAAEDAVPEGRRDDAMLAREATADYTVQLPIQEDETALVVWALWKHFERWRNVEAVRGLYGRLVKKAARFLTRYRDPTTRLPGPSYDLWEERRGIATFTCGAVVGGLEAGASFARVFGEADIAAEYAAAANDIRRAMEAHLYRPELGRFARRVNVRRSGEVVVDATLDSSLAGAFTFGAFAADDPRVVATMRAVETGLACKTEVGGVARYANDPYFQATPEIERVPGNPWLICSLWLAEHKIATARQRADLRPAVEILRWVDSKRLSSGLLPEQLHPFTGEPLSVAPLAWSHAAFVSCVLGYVAKYRALG